MKKFFTIIFILNLVNIFQISFCAQKAANEAGFYERPNNIVLSFDDIEIFHKLNEENKVKVFNWLLCRLNRFLTKTEDIFNINLIQFRDWNISYYEDVKTFLEILENRASKIYSENDRYVGYVHAYNQLIKDCKLSSEIIEYSKIIHRINS